jgi:tetratricopeptide (TPR) repeat protein
MRSFAALILSMLVLSAPAGAHSGIHDRLQAATRTIAETPHAGDPYIRRAYLLAEHGDWAAAFADLDQAVKYAAEADEIAYHRAELLYREATQTDDAALRRLAFDLVQSYLKIHPEHVEALLLRARLNQALGRPEAAPADYAHALRIIPTPTVGLYLEYARALQALGHDRDALATLQAGLADYSSPPPALIDAAIGLARSVGEPRIALRWFARKPALLRGLPNEMMLQGDLLRAAGDEEQAQAVYRAALRHWSELPPRRRALPAFRDLDLRLSGRIVDIGRFADMENSGAQ